MLLNLKRVLLIIKRNLFSFIAMQIYFCLQLKKKIKEIVCLYRKKDEDFFFF